MKTRFDSKPILLAGKVSVKGHQEDYFVTRLGLLRIKRAKGRVDVYAVEREARGYRFLKQKVVAIDQVEIEEEFSLS